MYSKTFNMYSYLLGKSKVPLNLQKAQVLFCIVQVLKLDLKYSNFLKTCNVQ